MTENMTRRDFWVIALVALSIVILSGIHINFAGTAASETVETSTLILLVLGSIFLTYAIFSAVLEWSGELRRSAILLGLGGGLVMVGHLLEVIIHFGFLPGVVEHVYEVFVVAGLFMGGYGFYCLANGPWFSR